YDLGNTVQNANSHGLNTVITMDRVSKSIGLVPSTEKRKKQNNRATERPQPGQKIERNKEHSEEERKKLEQEEKEGSAVFDAMIKVVTGLKTVNINYNEANVTVLPGFIPGLGFFGSSKPTLGFVFGAQDAIRYEAAKRGWLTEYPEFNQV